MGSAAVATATSPATNRRAARFDPAGQHPESHDRTVLLVVDDDITTRAMIRSYLEGPDISIFEAVSWREAGLFLRRHRVDGILLDLYLSDLNGIDACRKLHLHPSTRGVPVVLCTSRPSREAVLKGLKAGAADFLIKPFSRDRLIEKLDTVLHPT
jgi:DNA-binding response OmpR family regulator